MFYDIWKQTRRYFFFFLIEEKVISKIFIYDILFYFIFFKYLNVIILFNQKI
jgi:hypothetical protein